MSYRKKLIEVALPLPEINDASAYDKMPGIGAHPKGIHHWWARLPLPVSRAVLFASVVDDPSAHPERFPTEEAQERERERLFGILRKLMQKQLHKHPEVYSQARAEMLKHCDGKLPPVLDPFAGGGSIPLEAARLGMEAYAGDLNPVAVLICKAMLELVPRWTDWPPVNPEARSSLLGKALGAPLGAPPSSRQEKRPAKMPALPARMPEWRSRGYLPHFDRPGLIQAITFRLADSLPQEVLDRWAQELQALPEDRRQTEREKRIGEWLDRGYGACWLRDPDVARIVEEALLHFDGERYQLLAWCIMPNHVHVLVETRPEYPLAEVVHSWKSFTANQANRLLQREGAFWQREYHDRFIRDAKHLQQAIAYIEGNPVAAGLVKVAEEWPFSSASWRKAAGSAGSAAGSAAFQAARKEAGKDAGAPSVGAPSVYRGAAGLAADVRYYGRVILERARAKIGHLYPPVKVTAEMAEGRPDLKPYVGKALPVIAWLWARTVPSPNPAARGAHVPLMSTFWLSSKKGSEAWLEPIVEKAGSAGSAAGSAAFQAASKSAGKDAGAPGTWRFAVRTGPPKDREAVKTGTKTGRGQFRCLLTDAPITDTHIKAEGQAGRLDARLVAIVADTGRVRVYLPATEEHEAIAKRAEPEWKPDGSLAEDPRNIWCVGYGLVQFSDLFTPRQLSAMVTLSDLVREGREDVRRDAKRAGLSDAEAEEYARTVTTFLTLTLDRCADFNNALSRWKPSGQQQMQLFGRQAIPMVWDFAEANLLGEKAICWLNAVDICAEAVETILAAGTPTLPGHARPLDAGSGFAGSAAFQAAIKNAGKDAGAPSFSFIISTDPPYYDNIGYAALSDFFYVWLRRTIGDLYPDLFGTILVPKEPELVAAPQRFGGDKQKAKEHFEAGFRRAFAALREKMDPRFPLTVYYAFKQDDEESGADEEEANGGNGNSNRVDRTTGWETMLEALIGTGLQITATWPVRASQKWRMVSMGTNALASYIVLACRLRPDDAPQTDRRSFVAELKRELPAALKHLQQGNIAPVDFAQAAIGPGMAIYSKYRRILEASGRPMTVRTALALINQTLTEVLSEQEDEFDNDTRWAIAWFEQHGFEEGEFGQAELLSKAKVTSVRGLEEAGIVRAGGGKVRLLRPEELPKAWDPERDRRLPVWEMTHHLLRVYYHEKAGDRATADLLRKLGSGGELARDLAYRLFHLSEKKNRSQEAQAYNALVLGWPEIARLAREAAGRNEQPGLFDTSMV